MIGAAFRDKSMDGHLAEFVTLNMLNEQLAVVEHYLATTPLAPFTASRRDKLVQEQQQLQMLIQQKEMAQQEEDHLQPGSYNSSSPSESLSPAPSPQPPFINSNSASVSGFSTPDFWSASRDHNPFASVVEESLDLLPDDDRLAQELA